MCDVIASKRNSTVCIFAKQNKQYNVVLDLDNTIICAYTVPKDSDLEIYRKNQLYLLDYYDKYIEQHVIIFERPHLSTFLITICYNYNVYIFTNATNAYAIDVISRIQSKHNIVFTGYCTRITRPTENECGKYLSFFNINGHKLSWINTVIVDDNDEVWVTEKCCQIIIYPYDINPDDIDATKSDCHLLSAVGGILVKFNKYMEQDKQISQLNLNDSLCESTKLLNSNN